MSYPMLRTIHSPADLRKLTPGELEELCEELRIFMQMEARPKAGHVHSSLGVVELTVALHFHFDTPDDILIWDVGHQSYAHKILTGRREAYAGIRTCNGIAGFTSREESPYDPFGTGHSSTSISAAAGFAEAQRNSPQPRSIIAVIGDGALTGGMAYEALNYLGERKLPVLVVLNDNFSSIDNNVGALAAYDSYQAFFEALGWHYQFCAEGNELGILLGEIELLEPITQPTVMHIITEKGQGLLESFSAKTGASAYSYSTALGEIMKVLMRQNEELRVVSPAMLSGGGLYGVKQLFPERVLDAGIAEQHAVTMAAGLAAAGVPVLCHLYATFAQRAVDQIIHDVALQNLPVLFCIDRAGISGADGATHHGLWDTLLWEALPNLQLWEPENGEELASVLRHYLAQPTPLCIRYPKDITAPWSGEFQPAQPYWEDKRDGGTVVLSTGSLTGKLKPVCQEKEISHIHVARLCPFPVQELAQVVKGFTKMVVWEEHIEGGTPLKNGVEAVLKELENPPAEVHYRHLPAEFTGHGSRAEWLAHYGLDAEGLRQWWQNVIRK